MTGHAIVWTHDDDRVTARVECSQPPEAKCRWEPNDDACQCEEYGPVGIDEEGPFHEVWEYDLPGEPTVKHRMKCGGDCSVALWMNADPSTIAESADWAGEVEIGRTPIEVAWNHDYYTWKPVA